ncbi:MULTISPECIES: hypothetical protein [Vibrio]|jgi:hypothetical protein|uniref:Uncharacterized protein n=2 Tax=Vibrio TaxID=662 RepID=A0A329EHW0_VIBDI|nr:MULTISPECIES: hypothetical protein [Vibrio]MCZ4370268.1 hypothetical protein [Vibrio diazotrophicus]MDW6019227.1 hypothetical protein [Vibrio plantisponsor]NNM41903.1 hypothetical protein [Vibrio plantisponsor]PNH97583.1 hypothetical protein C1O25_19985 [Vibrio diazotrophicus]RAS65309.1 hypothetical protein DET48_10721 [Vibrio diazotrophicus]
MQISSLTEILTIHGYNFQFDQGKYKVKLGGIANKVTVSWDLSRECLNYSYGQILTPSLTMLWAMISMYNITNGELVSAVLFSGLTILGSLVTIITEIKVTELKRILTPAIPFQ